MKNLKPKIQNLSRCLSSLSASIQKEVFNGELGLTNKTKLKEALADLEMFNEQFKKFVKKFDL